MTYNCKRCNHEWTGKLNVEPKVCPRCKSYGWKTPPSKRYANRKKGDGDGN